MSEVFDFVIETFEDTLIAVAKGEIPARTIKVFKDDEGEVQVVFSGQPEGGKVELKGNEVSYCDS